MEVARPVPRHRCVSLQRHQLLPSFQPSAFYFVTDVTLIFLSCKDSVHQATHGLTLSKFHSTCTSSASHVGIHAPLHQDLLSVNQLISSQLYASSCCIQTDPIRNPVNTYSRQSSCIAGLCIGRALSGTIQILMGVFWGERRQTNTRERMCLAAACPHSLFTTLECPGMASVHIM